MLEMDAYKHGVETARLPMGKEIIELGTCLARLAQLSALAMQCNILFPAAEGHELFRPSEWVTFIYPWLEASRSRLLEFPLPP